MILRMHPRPIARWMPVVVGLLMSVSATAQSPARPVGNQPGNVKVVAVLPLGGLGIPNDIMRNLEAFFHKSITTMEGFDVIPPVDVQIAMQRHKKLAACGGGPKCAILAGRLLRADFAVFGTIGALGQDFSLNVRAVDVSTGKESGRVEAHLSGDRNVLIPEIRLAAYRLVAPDKIRGYLRVEIALAGVQVEIDGAVVGVTPFERPIELKPGDHRVLLKRPGYSEFKKKFTIRPFETAPLTLELSKEKE